MAMNVGAEKYNCSSNVTALACNNTVARKLCCLSCRSVMSAPAPAPAVDSCRPLPGSCSGNKEMTAPNEGASFRTVQGCVDWCAQQKKVNPKVSCCRMESTTDNGTSFAAGKCFAETGAFTAKAGSSDIAVDVLCGDAAGGPAPAPAPSQPCQSNACEDDKSYDCKKAVAEGYCHSPAGSLEGEGIRRLCCASCKNSTACGDDDINFSRFLENNTHLANMTSTRRRLRAATVTINWLSGFSDASERSAVTDAGDVRQV